MKSYTDIEQSKKLAEILSIESADMKILPFTEREYRVVPINDIAVCGREDEIPCWSLAALLSVLPDSIYDNTNEFSQLEFSKRSVAYHDINDGIKVGSIKDNLVDACYDMILKLHKLNLL
jgi:hypothetical protein